MTSRSFLLSLFFTTLGTGAIARATTLKRARGGREGGKEMAGGGCFASCGRLCSAESRLVSQPCRGRLARPVPGLCSAPRRRRAARLRLQARAGGSASPPRLRGLLRFCLCPALGAQLHRGSRVTATFNSQANEISIVKART